MPIRSRGVSLVVLVLLVGACSRKADQPGPESTATSTATAPPTAAPNPTSPTDPLTPAASPDGGEAGRATGAPTPTPTSNPLTPTVSPDGGEGGKVPPTPTAPPAMVPVTLALAVMGSQEVPLVRDGVTPVDPAASYRVEIATHLVDGRLSLHDAQDAMVASTGTAEVGGDVTRYRLTPVEPLQPASSYTLVVDGAVTREAHDAGGRAYGPFLAKLGTTGEKPPPPPKKRGKQRR